jgi:hypothetical protein
MDLSVLVDDINTIAVELRGAYGRPGKVGGSSSNYVSHESLQKMITDKDYVRYQSAISSLRSASGQFFTHDPNGINERFLYKVDDATNLVNIFYTVAVAVRGKATGEVIATSSDIGHEQMLSDFNRHEPTEGRIIDNYVRLNTRDGNLLADIQFSGVWVRSEEDKVKALDNIYTAMRNLVGRGLPGSTKLLITNNMRTVYSETTVGELVQAFGEYLTELRGAYGRKGKVGGSSKSPTSGDSKSVAKKSVTKKLTSEEPKISTGQPKGWDIAGTYTYNRVDSTLYEIKSNAGEMLNRGTEGRMAYGIRGEFKGKWFYADEGIVGHELMLKKGLGVSEQDFVRFTVYPAADGRAAFIYTNVIYSGVKYDDPDIEVNGLDFIYKAAKSLVRLGLPKDAEFVVSEYNQKKGTSVFFTGNDLSLLMSKIVELRGKYGRPGQVGGSSSEISTITKEEILSARAERLQGKSLWKGRLDKLMWIRGLADQGGWKECVEKYKHMQPKGFPNQPDLANLIYNAYEFSDPVTGYSSFVTSVEPSSGPGIFVKGYVTNNTGTTAAYFDRTISEGGVGNDRYATEIKDQGKGFGAAFYKNQEDYMTAAGCKRMDLVANSDIGGYAWARMGYEFLSPKFREKIQAKAELQWYEWFESSRDPNKVFTPVPQLNHPWEYAAMTSPWDTDMRFGQALLLGTSWEGLKRLQTENDGIIAGELYYISKESNT